MNQQKKKIVIVGAGFSGLAAAYDLANKGHEVEIIEKDDDIGGLAGTFEISPGYRVEKFYHHWFSSDTAILGFLKEIGLGEKIRFLSTNTGLYYANSIFRLTKPIDLLRFRPLSFLARIRTGILALMARKVRYWQALESLSAEDWIQHIAGKESYEVIWKPLLQGKFGDEAKNVSAVWFWNKMKLRGSSRDAKGAESLAYVEGGFSAVLEGIRNALQKAGVRLTLSKEVTQIQATDNRVTGVTTSSGTVHADAVLATVPLPMFTTITPSLPKDFVTQASQIRFLGNVCLILRLNQSLSDTYWLNVADPSFPFVGIIEHTNFDPPEHYGGEHIVYLSKYLPTTDSLFALSDQEFFDYAFPFIQKIFPRFSKDWVLGLKVWRAEYSQPIVSKYFSKLIPPVETPIQGLWLSTMAQIYPEDRGTNYAVKHARDTAQRMNEKL